MVNILNQITVGDLRIAVLSAAPNTGSGIAMELGSLAMMAGQNGIYQKTGSGDTDWTLSTIDAVQLGLDLAALDSRLDTLEADPVTKTYVDSQISSQNSAIEATVEGLQDQIDTEKGRIDAILLAADADKDSFAEIVQLINSVDTTNDNAFAAYVLSNDAALAAETLARENADDALENAIDAEALARQDADQDLQDAIDLVDAKEFVYEYSNLASFPALGEAQRIYVAKDTNYLYRFEQVVLPESYDWVVGSGGDFASLHDAMASASVLDGHKIKVLNGTYQSDVQLNISKKVKIYGESRAGVILQTSASTAAPVTMINVSVDDVLLKDMTIKHRKTNNTSVEAAVVASGGGFPQTRISNFIMDNCLVEHIEFGVVTRGTAWMVSNSTISYMGPTNSTRRHMGVYGFSGDCFILNNVFKDNAASGSVRAIAITSTTGTNPNETNEGNLLVEGNTQDGPMAQFISQDNWQGSAGSYNLFVKNNTTNETSAFVSFYGTAADFGNILGDITVEGNTLSNNHEAATGLGKGLIGIDGAGSSLSFRSSNLPIHALNNTLGQLSFRADYSEATGSSNSLVGYKTAVFIQPQVSEDDTIGVYPSAPAVPSAGGGTSSEYVKLSPDTGLLKTDGSRAMTAALDMGGFKVTNAAEPTSSSDLATKAYIDNSLSTETSARELADSGLQSQITTEKGRIDAILLAADADKDSFAEIVQLINSVDTTNDNAFASYVLSNNAALAAETASRESADSALDARLDTLEGADTVEGSVAKAEKDAKDYSDTKLAEQVALLTSADNNLEGYAQDIRDDLDNEIVRAQAEEALKLDKAGGTMSGDLNMGGNDIVNASSLGIGTATPSTMFELVESNVTFNVKSYSTSTTDGSAVAVASYAPASNSVEIIKVFVTGIDPSTLDSVSYERTVKVKNNGSSVSLGVVQSDYTSADASLSAAGCSIQLDGSSVKVNVTGVASKTIQWACCLQKVKYVAMS